MVGLSGQYKICAARLADLEDAFIGLSRMETKASGALRVTLVWGAIEEESGESTVNICKPPWLPRHIARQWPVFRIPNHHISLPFLHLTRKSSWFHFPSLQQHNMLLIPFTSNSKLLRYLSQIQNFPFQYLFVKISPWKLVLFLYVTL